MAEQQRVAVVTGTAGGVGGRLACTRAAEGWHVFAAVPADAYLTNVDLRPRQEVSTKFNV